MNQISLNPIQRIKFISHIDVLRLLGKKMEDYIDPDKLYAIKEPVKVDPPISDYIFKAVAKCTMTLSQAAERLRTK